MNNKNPLLIYSPIIEDGIPDLVKDTPEYDAYWGEHRHRCLEGYKPSNGVWIPGRYYWYLNIWKINRLKMWFDTHAIGEKFMSYPLYRDGDHELISLIEESHASASENKFDILIGKRRRHGVTDLIMGAVIAYELAMFPENNVGLGYPNDEAIANIYPHFEMGWNALPNAFYQKLNTNNKGGVMVGYRGEEGDDANEGEKLYGALSNFMIKKLVRSGVFKGAWYKTVWFDEIGEMEEKPTLEQALLDTQECVAENGRKFGIVIMSGTSDKINRNNPWYEKLWYDPEKYNIRTHFMPAAKMMWDFFDMSTGKSDMKSADVVIAAKYKSLEESDDKTAYIKFAQNNPRHAEDMFMWGGATGGVNLIRVNERARIIREDKKQKARLQIGDLIEEMKNGSPTGRVLFVKNNKGHWRIPEYGHPINEAYNSPADFITMDDYYKNDAPESDSMGSYVVWRRFISHDKICRIPVGIYLYRPTSREGGREAFHRQAILAARYWKAKIDFEYNDEGFKTFCEQNDYFKHLKTNIKAGGTVARTRDAYGRTMKEMEIITADNKIVDWVDSEYFDNVVDLLLLEQLTLIGRKNVDIISALRVAMLYEDDLIAKPVNAKEYVIEEDDQNKLRNRYKRSADGRIAVLNNRTPTKLFAWQNKKRNAV